MVVASSVLLNQEIERLTWLH